MNRFETIDEKLFLIRKCLDRYTENQVYTILEKDVLLAHIRQLYEEALFMGTDPASAVEACDPAGSLLYLKNNGDGKSLQNGAGRQAEDTDADCAARDGKASPAGERIAPYVNFDLDIPHNLTNAQKEEITHDLFGGDRLLFNEFMHQISRFSDLNEALIFIQENYAWPPDSHALKIIVDQLNDRLS